MVDFMQQVAKVKRPANFSLHKIADLSSFLDGR
jgi:hypothetical protein